MLFSIFRTKVTENLLEWGLQLTKIILSSDGCSVQYKGKTNFVNASFSVEDFSNPMEKISTGADMARGHAMPK